MSLANDSRPRYCRFAALWCRAIIVGELTMHAGADQ